MYNQYSKGYSREYYQDASNKGHLDGSSRIAGNDPSGNYYQPRQTQQVESYHNPYGSSTSTRSQGTQL